MDLRDTFGDRRKAREDEPMLFDTTFSFGIKDGGDGREMFSDGVADPVTSEEREEMFSAGMDTLAGEREVDSLFGGMGGFGMSQRESEPSIRANRTDSFERRTGRFRDPMSGEFEPGRAPPDLDQETERYRSAETGRFKSRSADLYDEPEEVRQNSLEPEG